MSVTKLDDGRWLAKADLGFNDDGKRDRRQRRFRTRAEAAAQDAKWTAEKEARKRIRSGGMTLSEFVERVYWAGKADLDDGTLRGYRRDWENRIEPMLGSLALDDIRRSDIQQMISACPTHKTARNARDTLSSMLGWAVQMDMLESNPAIGRWVYPKRQPKASDHDGVWLQSFAEIAQVMEKLRGDPDELLFGVGLMLGLRKGEILGLDWEDVDLDAGVAHIRRTYTSSFGQMEEKAPKTEQSARDVPIMGPLNALLTQHKAVSGPVCNIDGKRLAGATATRHVARARVRCGLPHVTLKSMRHSFATACIAAGIDVAVVSRMLGHTNVSTTYNRYVRPMQQGMKDAVVMMELATGWQREEQNPR